jgi:hypothetical protein
VAVLGELLLEGGRGFDVLTMATCPLVDFSLDASRGCGFVELLLLEWFVAGCCSDFEGGGWKGDGCDLLGGACEDDGFLSGLGMLTSWFLRDVWVDAVAGWEAGRTFWVFRR